MSSEQASSVGVVVAVRNMARHLGRALEAVMVQQPAPVDILVVDGASSDTSASVARSFPRVRVLDQIGSGLAAARNQGLKEVSGELVTFCDADDRWSIDSLALRLAALKSRPEAMAVVGRVVLEEIGAECPTSAQRERIGRSVAGFTPGALLARREVFDLVGPFDEGLQISSDTDWFLRLQQSSIPWLQIEATVLYKGARGDSLSTNVAQYRRELLTVARRFVHRRREQTSR
jgi:glycosyltransferase involved in cell wall biosynthesis